MRNIWLVIKHDIGVTFRQRSFWFLTLLMPVLLMAFNAYYIIQDSKPRGTGSDADEVEGVGTDLESMPAIGLVDKAGLLAEMPQDFPADLFVPFPDGATARAALEGGEIEQYVEIPPDYIASGQISVYDQNFQILRSGENMGVAYASDSAWVLQYLIDYNLVGDEQLLRALGNPIPEPLAKFHAINPPPETGRGDRALAEVVSSVMPYLYYFLLVMSSSYLMRSVVAEKENRTAEILLLSLHPREMMIGKILAMSVVTVVQVAVWVGGGILLLNRGADLLNATSFSFPPGFLVWAILFLVLGYLLYASVMAAAGAIAPNAREGAQVTWLLIIPLMPTLMFGSAFLEDPDGVLSMVLSLFPLSAPGAMVTRLAVAEVPLWQILASLAGLALTTYLTISLAARFFRAGNLLSHDSFNWRRLATGWRGVRATDADPDRAGAQSA
jgi:ABC-2 type transport system permease protein